MQSTLWNARLDESQAGIKIAGRNINNLRYAHDTTLMAESKEELKSLLMKVKEESEKDGLKLNIKKTKIMASSPITLWQMKGKKWNQWQIFFSWAPKSLQMVTAAMKLKFAGSWEGTYDKPRQHSKKPNITLLKNVGIVKAMVFPVVMYGCESWTIKRLSAEKLMPSYCGAGEDSWKPLGLQGDQTSQS